MSQKHPIKRLYRDACYPATYTVVYNEGGWSGNEIGRRQLTHFRNEKRLTVCRSTLYFNLLASMFYISSTQNYIGGKKMGKKKYAEMMWNCVKINASTNYAVLKTRVWKPIAIERAFQNLHVREEKHFFFRTIAVIEIFN